MKPRIKVVFASGTDDLNARLIGRMQEIFPELPLWVVSEFPPSVPGVRWVRYQIDRPLWHNLARCRAAFRGFSIRLAAVMLVPGVPLRRLRLLAFLLAPWNTLAFNENLNHFMLRPRSVPSIARHLFWRAGNFIRWRMGARPATPTPAAAPSESAKPPEIRATVFRPRPGRPRVLIASPYVPFPLSHGGAVRMYNLMRRAAAEFDQILIAFAADSTPPPPELTEICAQVTLVPRIGSHLQARKGRPDAVEEFASAAFRDALRRAVREWRPQIAQLEFTQMAQYARDCAPAATILVEHDVTFDLHSQLLALGDDWDLRRQLKLWERFERSAWREVDRVVVMSRRDQALVTGARAVVLPNGADLDRFHPSPAAPEPDRLLFIGSFAHLPNLLAAEFFVHEVWPRLANARLHVIAGARYEDHLALFQARSQTRLDLAQPGMEIEGFVAGVRPAYARAAIVIAPLTASAGTNIKILEAMAMGKPIVSTPAGVHGLDLSPGEDFLLASGAEEFAGAIRHLLANPRERERLGAAARRRVEQQYNWDSIARAQMDLYRELSGAASASPEPIAWARS